MAYKVEYLGRQRVGWSHRKPTWAVVREYETSDFYGLDYTERRVLSRHHNEEEAKAELQRWRINEC